MTDPIRDLIAAARAVVAEWRDTSVCANVDATVNALVKAIAAAEARPEPKPFCGAQHPTRAVVQCRMPAGHEGHHQHAGVREGYTWLTRPEPAAEQDPEVLHAMAVEEYNTVPEPAAEPSGIPPPIGSVESLLATAKTYHDFDMLCDAVEALARETRPEPKPFLAQLDAIHKLPPMPPEPPSEFDAAIAEASGYFTEDPQTSAIIAAIKALAREVRRG